VAPYEIGNKFKGPDCHATLDRALVLKCNPRQWRSQQKRLQTSLRHNPRVLLLTLEPISKLLTAIDPL